MHANTRTILWKTSYLGLALVGALHGSSDVVWSAAEAPAEPKSIGKTCGKCPDGYATTGVTQSPEICKEGDATLVQDGRVLWHASHYRVTAEAVLSELARAGVSANT